MIYSTVMSRAPKLEQLRLLCTILNLTQLGHMHRYSMAGLHCTGRTSRELLLTLVRACPPPPPPLSYLPIPSFTFDLTRIYYSPLTWLTCQERP